MVSIQIKPNLWKRFKKVADKRGMKIYHLLNKILEEYLADK